jgi:hypothetical protein
MKNLRTILITGIVLAVIIILAIIYMVIAKNPKTEPVTNISNSADTTNTNANTAPEPTENTYTNSEYNFTFTYPKNLKSGTQEFTFVPSGANERIELETQFIHEINSEYCAPSGDCKPTTQDFGFGVSVIPSSVADLQKRIETPMTSQRFGNVTAYTMNQGVEGEGINYYFVSLSNTSTLMFDQRYIDENTLIGYKNVKEFIPYRQQNDMMKTIISSLKLSN